MSELSNFSTFSKYNLHARLYPGLLMSLPVTVLAVPLVPSTTIAAVLPLLASSGVLLVVVHQVRSLGIKTEERLKIEWDGMPTTRRLRLRNKTNATLLNRRRKKLQALYGEPLPDAEMEQVEPTAADEIYAAATRHLITKARQQEDLFPLVQEEVTNYGFRRNFRGVKWLAVLLTLVCLMADGMLGYFVAISEQTLATAVFHIAYLLAVLLVVKDSWVLQVGERYADRLFEALDTMDEPTSNW